MMKDLSKVTTMTANSVIENVVTVGMRATLNEDGTWNIAKTIRNSEVYVANKEACDADYVEFEAEVLRMAQA